MWIRFEDRLPTDEEGGQVDILFCCPEWATFHRGLYTHWLDYDLRQRLFQYDVTKDRFYDWENTIPTHWMLSPELPTNTLFQVGEKVCYDDEQYLVYEIDIRQNDSSDYWLRHSKDNSITLVEECFIEKI